MNYYDVDEETLNSKTRKAEIVQIRHFIVYMIRYELGLTFREISDILNKENSTIIRNFQTISDRIMRDKMLQLEIQDIKKLNCDEVMNKFSQYNISFPKEVTKHDVSYVLHMFLSDYGNLNIQENVLLKLVYNYIIDPDYPILNGKTFAEWKLNNCYPNIKKNKNKQAIKRNLFSLFIY